MADLILHHYPNSPFSEKVRIAFGIKQLAWKSVQIPVIMPKPDLMPLTGGYRKTPVLQVGADIYCDTQLIMLELEKRAPRPPLLPTDRAGEARALAMWVDRNIFWSAVGVVMGAIGDKLPESFHKDRSAFSGRSFDVARLKEAAPVAAEQTYAQLVLAESWPTADPICWAPTQPWPTVRSTIRCGSSRSGWARARRCRRSTGCRGSSPGRNA